MKIKHKIIKRTSHGRRPTFHDITDEASEFVDSLSIREGQCLVYSRHTTCSVIIEEDSIDESYSGLTFLQQDLIDVFEKLIPRCIKEGQYMHPGPEMAIYAAEHGEDKESSLNTDAHLRSSIIGRSETIPIIEGELMLGTYGKVYFIDFDQTESRDREIVIQVIHTD